MAEANDTQKPSREAVDPASACSISTWWRRYRTMPDCWSGFQAEVWTIWWPFWRQIGFTNTHSSTILLFPQYVDEHGNPVHRTKHTHPWNYDGFVQERCGKNSEANGTIWTDRLLQWDYGLTRRLLIKHFKDTGIDQSGDYYDDTGIDQSGDYYDKRSAEAIERFLRERLSQPENCV